MIGIHPLNSPIDDTPPPIYPKSMQVNLQYAEEHFADLAAAVDSGQEVEIARPDKPTLKLVASPALAAKQSLLNSAKGQIQFADDWDSPQTNQEIADLFEGSALVGRTVAE